MRRVLLTALGLSLGPLFGCPFTPPSNSTQTVALERVAGELAAPVALAVPADGAGRLFVASQAGQVHAISKTGERQTTPFLDLADRMVALKDTYEERGLLGLAFHPDYANNGRFYVYYSAPPADPNNNCDSRLSEFTVSADPLRADDASERVLLSIPKKNSGHNAGQLAFGPDGYLYLSTGDGGSPGDIGPGHNPDIGNAQDKTTLLGKILRIDVNNGDPYAIPADNPFLDDPATRPEIYALGFRNPWRFSFDAADDQPARLFVGDVGQIVREEINLVEAGGNYGWRIREGSTCFNVQTFNTPLSSCSSTDADGRELRSPIIEYGRQLGRSVIGGYVYRGSAIPGLQGQYVFGDFSAALLSADGRLYVASQSNSGSWSFESLAVQGRPNGLETYLFAMGQDDEGELYLLTSPSTGVRNAGGELFRIVPASP